MFLDGGRKLENLKETHVNMCRYRQTVAHAPVQTLGPGVNNASYCVIILPYIFKSINYLLFTFLLSTLYFFKCYYYLFSEYIRSCWIVVFIYIFGSSGNVTSNQQKKSLIIKLQNYWVLEIPENEIRVSWLWTTQRLWLDCVCPLSKTLTWLLVVCIHVIWNRRPKPYVCQGITSKVCFPNVPLICCTNLSSDGVSTIHSYVKLIQS